MSIRYDFFPMSIHMMVLFGVFFLVWFAFAVKTAVCGPRYSGRSLSPILVVFSLLVCFFALMTLTSESSLKESVVASFESKPITAKIFLLENEIKIRERNISHQKKQRTVSRKDVETGVAYVASMTEEELARRLRNAREAHAVLLDVPEGAAPRD